MPGLTTDPDFAQVHLVVLQWRAGHVPGLTTVQVALWVLVGLRSFNGGPGTCPA